jgi:hypothetical protein
VFKSSVQSSFCPLIRCNRNCNRLRPHPFYQATGPNHEEPVDISSVVVYELVSTGPTLSLDRSLCTTRCKVRIYISVKFATILFVVLGCSLSGVMHHSSSGRLVVTLLTATWHLDASSDGGKWEGECQLTCAGADPGW